MKRGGSIHVKLGGSIGVKSSTRLRHKDFNVTMEPAQQITQAQLKETVRRHFGQVAKRHWPDGPGQPPH